jgi:DnaJ-class molecular chaperone
VAETKEVTIKIPAGVESGATMRVRDGGSAGMVP